MSSDQVALDPVLMDQIRAHAQDQQLGLMIMFIGLSVAIYDFFITLADEIELVWAPRPHLRLAKCIFFVNRYSVIFSTIYRVIIELNDQVLDRVGYMTDPPPCSKLTGRIALNWITVTNWTTIETMLVLCVYGLWEQSNLIGAVLVVVVVGGVSAAIAMSITMKDKRLDAIISLEPEWLFPCQAWEPVTRFWLYVLGTFVQVSVFILFIWRVYQIWKPGTGTRSTKLSKTLWIYCIMYYSVTLALMGVGIASALVKHMYLPIYTAQVLVPIVSLVALRLCLSLRQLFFARPLITLSRSRGLDRSEGLSLDVVRHKHKHVETTITTVSGYEIPTA